MTRRMTEAEIEYRVEKTMDRLDHNLMTNSITQEEYDREVVRLDRWASQQYRHLDDKPLHKMKDEYCYE